LRLGLVHTQSNLKLRASSNSGLGVVKQGTRTRGRTLDAIGRKTEIKGKWRFVESPSRLGEDQGCCEIHHGMYFATG
jgi:hypothetical protein